MALVLTRSFLLLLLACDWAGDPDQGLSLLSRPLASEEVYPFSLVEREALRRQVAGVHHTRPAPSAAVPAAAPPQTPDQPPRREPRVLTGTAYVYFLKTLRR